MQHAHEKVEALPRLLTMRETMALTTLGRTSLWKLSKEGRFPSAVRLNGRVAFFESEIRTWLANRPRAFSGGAGNAE